jgi:citrate synthase
MNTTKPAPPPAAKTDAKRQATISFDGKQELFPILEGTEGELAIDLTKLRARTGMVGFDPGYGNTASCRSGITFIDGEKGILKYRGIPIEELAERATFLETAFLLLNGDLPTREQLDGFSGEITRHTMLHEDIKRFFSGFPKEAHPMAICAAVVAALSAFYPELLNERLRSRSRHRPRARDSADSARRSRTELLSQHGAHGRLVQRQPFRQHFCRHRCAVGTAARRRESEGHRNAGRD